MTVLLPSGPLGFGTAPEEIRPSQGLLLNHFLKGPYNANSTFIVLLYVHMRSWHVSQPTNA